MNPRRLTRSAPPVLHAFALAIGLSVSSAAPTWRDASFALVLLSALYVVLVALASYGLDGYLTGLMRTRPSSREGADLGDGLHGLSSVRRRMALTLSNLGRPQARR
jgi:hypothetical protein